MMTSTSMPSEVRAAVGNEKVEFAVETQRAYPRKKGLSNVLFGAVWLAFISSFFVLMWGPIFMGNEVHFTANKVPQVAGPGNLRPLLVPTIFVGVFVLIGLVILISGLRTLFARGGWFVGTPTRMIVAMPTGLRSIDWEQFSGDIAVTGRGERASVVLYLHTPAAYATIQSDRDRNGPEQIAMVGVANATSIAETCRQRIKENDPTPGRA